MAAPWQERAGRGRGRNPACPSAGTAAGRRPGAASSTPQAFVRCSPRRRREHGHGEGPLREGRDRVDAAAHRARPPTMVRVRPRPPGMGSSIACSNPSSGESCSGSAIIGLASRPPGTTASRVGASGNGSAHWISQPRLPRGGVTTHDNDTRKWLPSSPCKSAYQASQWLGSPSSRGRRSEPADSAGSRVISAMRLRIHSQQRVRAVTATNTKMTGDTRWRLE
jgi:hypothetical protein